MSHRQFLTLALLTSFFGLLGGGVSNYFFGEKAEAQMSNTVIADRFILSQQGNGQYGAELGFDDEGFPTFFINDDKGKKRINMGMDKGGITYFSFFDPFNKSERMAFYTAFDGAPFVQLNDKNGSPRAILGMGEEENVILEFYDKSARPVWLVPKIFKKKKKKKKKIG